MFFLAQFMDGAGPLLLIPKFALLGLLIYKKYSKLK
ncbi:hypothetical protein NEOC65_001521 [Neochlamydia sp. AcF65]|nr:hypothetical protein [Neochlamydia sp. AcF65]MBS4169330.1 hypothetical protein [Neochlamydia sp. AcF95]